MSFTHHYRAEYFYLSLVCTLAPRLSTLTILRFVSFLYLRRGSNPHGHCCPRDFKSRVSTSFTTKAYLGEWWASIPLPPESQSGALPIELHTPYQYRMLGSNQPKAGYEPTSSTQDLRHFIAESIGIEPNTLTGTHCLAGKPYRHQGLLSNCANNWTRTNNLPRIRRML